MFQGRYILFAEQRKIADKLCRERVQRDLCRKCDNRGKHACVSQFAAVPDAVWRWRKLWYPMAKVDRNARLIAMFTEERNFQTLQHLGDTDFAMKFKFLGSQFAGMLS